MIKFTGMKTSQAQHYWKGGADAHGQKPQTATSDGNGNPCRHCLRMIKRNEPFLVLSYRPFQTVQPYAEQGPVFLHAEPCKAHEGKSGELAPVLEDSPAYMLRGYDDQERIVYGSGKIVDRENIVHHAADMLQQTKIEFVHVRSASNNCWQARIDAD